MDDFVTDHNLDVLCITETWVSNSDNFSTNSITPCGFSVVSASRIGKRGGGIAVIIKNQLKYKRHANFTCSTFEVLLLHVTSFTKTFAIAIIYRPPGPLGSFLTELNEFLVTLVSTFDDFLLLGDFNIHIDLPNDDSSKKLMLLLNDFSLKQHINVPTHVQGHTLDLLISQANSQLVKSFSVTEGISDHNGVIFELSITKQRLQTIKKTFHQYKKFDVAKFENDVINSVLYTNLATDADACATQYQSVVSNLVSIHAPIVSLTVTQRPPAPWYTPEIGIARHVKRRLERRWRHTKLTVDREIFLAQKLLFNKMLVSAKAKYYVNLVDRQCHNPKQLWATIHSLTGNIKSQLYLTMMISYHLLMILTHFLLRKLMISVLILIGQVLVTHLFLMF